MAHANGHVLVGGYKEQKDGLGIVSFMTARNTLTGHLRRLRNGNAGGTWLGSVVDSNHTWLSKQALQTQRIFEKTVSIAARRLL
jgi:hypothetical protein